MRPSRSRCSSIAAPNRSASNPPRASTQRYVNSGYTGKRCFSVWPAGFGAALQIQQMRPRSFRIDVIGRQRRDAAPIVDAAVEQPLVSVLA